jgi:hypothetical protein
MLVHRQYVYDMTFYRLTDNETWLARLDQFIDWRVGWLARARRVEQLVGPAHPLIGKVGELEGNGQIN